MQMESKSSLSNSARRVAVFGGGPGGLTVAHELAERGFEVDLYERNALGGKARSYRITGTGEGGREDLPAEIGPHVVMGHYASLPEQLRRIPGRKGGSIFDEIAPLPGARISWKGWVADFPTGPDVSKRKAREITHAREMFNTLTFRDKLIILCKAIVLLTSGKRRQLEQLEHQSVSEFLNIETLSPKARQWVKIVGGAGIGVIGRMNARALAEVVTGFFNISFGKADFPYWFKCPTGPFSDVVWEPWGDYLRQLGVRIHLQHELKALSAADGLIRSATVRDANGNDIKVDADMFVLAVPPERAAPLLQGELAAIDPNLAKIALIEPTFLCGMTLYFTKPMPELYKLHFSASQPWGIAAINYEKLWDRSIEENFGDGAVKAYISIDIPDWEAPGILYGKPARELNAQQVYQEVLAQLRIDLPNGEQLMDESAIHSWHLSPTIQTNGDEAVTHVEHLFVNTPSSLQNQPDAVTGIPNLFLSAAYVRTDAGMGVDSMDSAAEAGRRAANGVIAVSGVKTELAHVPTLTVPFFMKPFKALDDLLFAVGVRNVFDLFSPSTQRRKGGRPC